MPRATYEDPIPFRPGKGIRPRVEKTETDSGIGRSKLINAALHDFLLRHRTPEQVLEAVKAYQLAQIKEAKRKEAR